MSRRNKVVAVTMVSGLLGGLLLAAPAAVADQSHDRHAARKVRLDWTPVRTGEQVTALRRAQPAVVGNLQTFTKTIHDATNFTYTMVGKDPFVAQATPVTTVSTYLQPVIVKSTGQTWDPTAGDSCDATSALTRTQRSPIFKAQNWSFAARVSAPRSTSTRFSGPASTTRPSRRGSTPATTSS